MKTKGWIQRAKTTKKPSNMKVPQLSAHFESKIGDYVICVVDRIKKYCMEGG